MSATIPEAYERLEEAISDLVYMKVGADDIRHVVEWEIERAVEAREESEIAKGETWNP